VLPLAGPGAKSRPWAAISAASSGSSNEARSCPDDTALLCRAHATSREGLPRDSMKKAAHLQQTAGLAVADLLPLPKTAG